MKKIIVIFGMIMLMLSMGVFAYTDTSTNSPLLNWWNQLRFSLSGCDQEDYYQWYCDGTILRNCAGQIYYDCGDAGLTCGSTADMTWKHCVEESFVCDEYWYYCSGNDIKLNECGSNKGIKATCSGTCSESDVIVSSALTQSQMKSALCSETTPIYTCGDTDGGIKSLIKGTTTGYLNGNIIHQNTDYCIDSENLAEFYCQDNKFTSIQSNCNYCSDGKCGEAPPTTTTTTTLQTCMSNAECAGDCSICIEGKCRYMIAGCDTCKGLDNLTKSNCFKQFIKDNYISILIGVAVLIILITAYILLYKKKGKRR